MEILNMFVKNADQFALLSNVFNYMYCNQQYNSVLHLSSH